MFKVIEGNAKDQRSINMRYWDIVERDISLISSFRWKQLDRLQKLIPWLDLALEHSPSQARCQFNHKAVDLIRNWTESLEQDAREAKGSVLLQAQQGQAIPLNMNTREENVKFLHMINEFCSKFNFTYVHVRYTRMSRAF